MAETAPGPAHFVRDPQTKMFTCCLPRSRGCRRKKAHPANAVPPRCRVRAPHCLWPFGQKDHKTTDEIGRRLADIRSISGTWGVTPQGSPGAGAGDCGGRPPTPTRPLSLVVIDWIVLQEPDATEVEPEAEKPGAGCLWVCGDGSGLTHREEPPEAGVGPGAKTGLQSRRPGEGSVLAAASLGGPGLGSVLQRPTESMHGVSFSPLTAAPPPKELELAPTPSAALQGGVVPAETSAGDQEPAGDLAPAHGEPDADQEGPAGEPVPGEPAPVPATVPAGAGAPVPAPNCGSAPSPDPAPAPPPAPTGLPEPQPEPISLRGEPLVQLPLVPSADPNIPPYCFMPSPYFLSLGTN
ncbi:skin secretory protein xP2-like [Zalophus californianus]|uniref:Skin secretory protein xP2-like n=1 Tax=Zalophus californianus TaxID=9704 RepID=A0A6J2EXZ8_ZALCA|nr:skin secretory protein xP2-like [Zalophus californianus]